MIKICFYLVARLSMKLYYLIMAPLSPEVSVKLEF